jgi:hypothetical protein
MRSLYASSAAALLMAAVIVTVAPSVRAVLPYTEALAWRALDYSAAVKCGSAAVRDWSCGKACNQAGPLANITLVADDPDEVRGFVGYDNVSQSIVLSFRGSVTLLNWLEDFDATLIPYTGDNAAACGSACQVHKGFFTTYSYMAQTLLPAFSSLLSAFPNATVMVTGHSMGAAQAQLALLDVLRLTAGSDVAVTLVNFGCPRLANPAMAEWAAAWIASQSRVTVYRLVNNEDPVPMLPLTLQGYQHFPRDFIWYSPSLPSPGWVLCNTTGVQAHLSAQDQSVIAASRNLKQVVTYARLQGVKLAAAGVVLGDNSTCGGDLFKLDPSDHVDYLGSKMGCNL